MRVSELFGLALREAPSEAEIPSHRLLLRAGYVRQLAAGIFSHLPLGVRSMAKIERILREEMERIGGQEISMPVVHPAEPWQASGRWSEVDETMVRFEDRRGHPMLLAMTHEEVVTTLARSEVASYRQLPLLVYQLQTKFRDELRPRAGLIRVREFVMKDSYSLDRDQEGLLRQYRAHYDAYLRIGGRCGLPLVAVESDVGMMGGLTAHEFAYPTPAGEDRLALCTRCEYAANLEVARFRRPGRSEETPLPLESVETPGTRTIAGLAELLGVPASRTAKVVFFVGRLPQGEEKLLFCVVRGDTDANPLAVQRLTGAVGLRPAHEEEILAAGAVPGFASPIGIEREGVLVVADTAVAEAANLVSGANEPDRHLRNVNHGRDWEADRVGEIAYAHAGAACVECGGRLELSRGVEVGNIFQLGTRYSEAIGATYTDESGEERPIVLGSYGIGVGRLLACVAEEHHDEHGLALPISVAPFETTLVSLPGTEETRQMAEDLYAELGRSGIEVLYDDRDASPGVKLTEADLRGIPLRVVVSERGREDGSVELELRTTKDRWRVARGEAVAAVRRALDALREEPYGTR